ncbi:MAG TPA: GNAT family N-acetyltransferase [Polyangiaceae bacterium]
MASDLLLRDLAGNDLDDLLALYRSLHSNEERVETTRAAEIWAEILSDSRQLYLGGFVGDLLVVACAVAIIPNLTRGGRPYAVIENVVTAAPFRRRGYGATLLRAAINRCWLGDCYKIMLMSAADRAGAHQFYESLGFDRQSKQAFVLKR